MKFLRRKTNGQWKDRLKLLSQEESLRLLLDQNNYGVWTIDLLDNSIDVDEGWCNTLQLQMTAELQSRQWWQQNVHPDDKAAVVEAFNTHLNDTSSHYQCEYRLLNGAGEYVWVQERGRVVGRNRKNQATRVVGILQSVNEKKKTVVDSEKKDFVLRSLYAIFSAESESFPAQVQRLLELGCEFLNMRCGIVSYVEGNRYTVLHVYTTSEKYKIEAGDVFDLGITYCKFTLDQNCPVGFAHAGKTAEISAHPSYAALKLEAYLGTPLFLRGTAYGTLNFSSIEPRDREFTDGEKYCVQLMAEWISNKLQNQFIEKLQVETHKKLAMHLQHSPLAAIEWTSNFRVKKWSHKAQLMFGWEEQMVINKSPRDWPLKNIDGRNNLENLARQLESCREVDYAFTCDLITYDGDNITSEWFISNSSLSDKSHTLVQTLVLDITERIRAENELLKSNARYVDLYQNAPDMYFSLDGAGNILSANKFCYELLGYEEDELLGKPFWNLVVKDHVRRVRRHVDVAMAGEVEEFEIEINILTKDSRQLKTHQRIRIIEAKKGLPRELRVLCRDITERKEVQQNRFEHIKNQRDEISRETQHRVKNSLQAVVGLLKVNLDTHPELKEILTAAISQVDTIAIVNTLMMEGARADIKLEQLLERLIYASSNLFRYEIKFQNNLDELKECEVTEDEAISVSLIISELLINALKHHASNAQGEDLVLVQVDNGHQGDVIIQIANSVSSEVNAEEEGGTQIGISMIEALMPPRGAELLVERSSDNYQTRLKLHEPVVNYVQTGEVISNNKFAS